MTTLDPYRACAYSSINLIMEKGPSSSSQLYPLKVHEMCTLDLMVRCVSLT